MKEEGLRVLIIEDEVDIREMLVSQFIESGMCAEGLENGKTALAKIESFRPDLILVDQMMPEKSGHEVIREVRSSLKFSELPIMMVTGLNSEQEKVLTLELGADDYVTKPFSPREVIARAQALVRRSKAAHRSNQKSLQLGELVVDLLAHKILLRGKEMPLTLTEYRILVELIHQSGMVLSRDKLREKALCNLNVTDRTIDVHMASLRKKLEDWGDRIETVRGVGYRLAS